MQALPLLVSRALTESSQLNITTDGSGATPDDSATADTSEPGADDVDVQSAAALAVLIQIFLIGASLLIGRLLERYNVTWMSEASAALLMGMVSGVLAWHFSTSATFKNWMKFQPEFFFLGLLPPIIFEAGYSLDVKPFFSNIGAICMFAFFGTTVSTFCIGFVMWVFGLMGAVYSMSLLENLVFGAIVSATDPVTVLAVFQRLRADENLYSLVFGESVLNDAVAIVLYNTLLIYTKQSVTAASLFWGLGVFVAVFVGSMLTGIVFGVLAALLFKTGWLRGSHAPLESAFVVVLAYSSYYTAECLALSPIVSILFCGMVMAKYARPNLSSRGNSRSGAFFQMFAHLAETFVFLYIGATLFLDEQSWHRGRMWSYLVVALLALGGSRALHVLPSSAFVNLFRPREQRIPQSHQFMLWFSGLRGAIAFALALQASRDLPDEQAARVLLTCTFFIVLLTVLFNGGAATFLLNRLQLRADPGDGSVDAEQQRLWPMGSSSDCLLHTAAESMLSPTASGALSSQHTPSASATPTSTLKSPRYLDKVIEFNRTGGLAARFQPLDRVLTQVLTRDRSPSQDELELTSAAPQTPVRQPLPTPGSAPGSLRQADPEQGTQAMLGAGEGGSPTQVASGVEADLSSRPPL